MSDIVSAEAAAQEGEALLPSAELAESTLAASIVLTFSTIVYMQGGLHSYFYARRARARRGLVAACVAALLVFKFSPAFLTKPICRIGRPQHRSPSSSAWWSAGALGPVRLDGRVRLEPRLRGRQQ